MKWWSAPLVITAALAAAPLQAADPSGRWNTPWGEMQLTVNGGQVDGQYGHNGGRVSGRLVGDTFTGYWLQTASERRCNRVVGGTPYWGQVKLRFSGERFDGHWGYCEQAPDRGGWNGTRVAEQAPSQEPEDDPTALVLGALAKALPPEASRAIGELLGNEAPPAPAADTRRTATPPPAVTYDMARNELWSDWKSGLQHGRPQTLAGDLTCDGADDYFVGWTDLDNPDRKAYHIAVVYHDGERLTHHHTDLDLGGNGQYAVCTPGPNRFPTITLTGHALNDASRAAHNLPAGCTGAVKLDDGMCDAIYIGWEPALKRFVLHRN